MTIKQKNNLIAEIIALLEKSIVVDVENPKPQVCNAQSQPLEMLTVKECSQIISGLSEHTVRQWVAQGLIPYIRTGKGKRGKILISKAALLKYLNSAA
ncbi:MAG: helix-turn-helix domain-containing protein [Oscillospiraceae bacterium]|nr:helix-turn-helix domain-containing protein [Oscillospiraceae bacterium]